MHAFCNRVNLYDSLTGKHIFSSPPGAGIGRTFSGGHTSSVYAVAFSHDQPWVKSRAGIAHVRACVRRIRPIRCPSREVARAVARTAGWSKCVAQEVVLEHCRILRTMHRAVG